MVINKLKESPEPDNDKVKALIQKRLKEIHQRECHTLNVDLRSFYESQEAILEEVLLLAKGNGNDKSLIFIIDYCIEESQWYHKLSTNHGLKSYYSLRVRVLRSALRLIRAIKHPKKWLRRKSRSKT